LITLYVFRREFIEFLYSRTNQFKLLTSIRNVAGSNPDHTEVRCCFPLSAKQTLKSATITTSGISSRLFIYYPPTTVTNTVSVTVNVKNCALLDYYAASSGNFLPTFRDNPSVPFPRVKNGVLTPEDGTDRLSRNVRKELPLIAT
jgi:hypothetical protein